MGAPGVLFDVDGTLIDNSYLHTLAWARAFADAGEEASMAAIHRLIGMGSSPLTEELLGEDRPDLSEGHSTHIAELEADMRAFPRAAELLEAVARRGATVVLATSAKPDEIEKRVEMIGAGDAVTHVTHSGEVDASKPDPEIFRTAMEAAGLDRDDCVVVGDSVWDVQAATAAGVACIGVECGGVSAAELREAGAIAVYEDPAALLESLDESPIGALLRRAERA
jgi:HAD superfamily hydrolase (TIGR01549 family)